jgi:hypothetical protein
MINAIKLNKTFDLPPYLIGNSTAQLGKIVNGVYRGIRYFTIDNSEVPHLLTMIPKKYREQFKVNWVEMNCTIPIHTDSLNQTAINIYYKTDNATTNFYRPKNENSHYIDQSSVQQQHVEVTPWFLKKDVEYLESFCAKVSEGWLFNNQTPHDVQPIIDDNAETFVVRDVIYRCNIHRTFVQIWSSVYTFDDVKQMLEYTGYIDK